MFDFVQCVGRYSLVVSLKNYSFSLLLYFIISIIVDYKITMYYI